MNQTTMIQWTPPGQPSRVFAVHKVPCWDGTRYRPRKRVVNVLVDEHDASWWSTRDLAYLWRFQFVLDYMGEHMPSMEVLEGPASAKMLPERAIQRWFERSNTWRGRRSREWRGIVRSFREQHLPHITWGEATEHLVGDSLESYEARAYRSKVVGCILTMKGCSAADLAEMMRVSEMTAQGYLVGETTHRLPALEMLEAWADAYGQAQRGAA